MRCIEEHDELALKTTEAARQLGVSFRDLYRLIDTGMLPAYKVGRDVKLRQADVDEYLRGRTAGD